MKFITYTLGALSLAFSLSAGAVTIANVFHSAVKNKQAAISFYLSDAASVGINIYDDRNYLIRDIMLGKLSDGDHTVNWDLNDKNGVKVPSEAYKYTISAIGSDGVKVIHDLSDNTGGEAVKITDTHYNKATGNIEFALTKPSRVLIRAGLSGGGPLLVTLSNWVAFATGLHTIPWDGMDASGVINVRDHAKLYFDVRAYSLSINTIIVGKNNNSVNLIDVSNWKTVKRGSAPPKKKVMFAANQQATETRGDYLVSLELAQNSRTEDGIPVVSGTVPVKLSVHKENVTTAINRRAEPTFYVDGVFSYENEVGFYPMIWKLDTKNLNEGVHYLTVNLRGYEGNFGLASTRIMVKHQKDGH